MAIKTFNLDEDVYKQISAHCKKNGISMSKMVENFLRGEISKLKIKKSGTVDKGSEKNIISSTHHSFSKYC